jgi:hypothetical protein
VRLDDPRDLPRVAGHLNRATITRIHAPREQLQRSRPGRDPARRAQSALGDDRDLAEVAVDVQRYRSRPSLLGLATRAENWWANDVDGSARRNRASRTGGH